MPKATPNLKKRDVVQEALAEVLHVTGMELETNVLDALIKRQEAAAIAAGKNPAAVMLGRKGGLKGGPARMAALSKEERSKLGSKAVAARWRKVKLLKQAGITTDEMKIVKMAQGGKTAGDIAKLLGISPNTVKSHRKSAEAALAGLTASQRELLARH